MRSTFKEVWHGLAQEVTAGQGADMVPRKPASS
jgi:hypothetical protein